MIMYKWLALVTLCVSSVSLQSQTESPVLLCGELPQGHGLNENESGLVDRFNHAWRPGEHLKKWTVGRRAQAIGCGGFQVDFEDVILDNGIGFDDPTPVNHSVLGATTWGEVRQRTVCEVFRYIGSLINVQGVPDIIIRESWDRNDGILGAASPFFSTNESFSSGTLFNHLMTGADPTPDAGDYDAFIRFNFYYDWNSDWSQPSGSRFDLYSLTLHEITHALGFLSLIGSNGSSRIDGAYSHYDLRVHDGSGRQLINPSSGTFTGSAVALVSNQLAFQTARCSGENPVYSPPFYQSGSSLSHFDKFRSGIDYVMHPSTSGGDKREYTVPELQTLCELGYRLKGGLCGNCAPQGVPDFATTISGIGVCIDVLANDSDPDGDPVSIDPISLEIEVGGGIWHIDNDQLCYTPPHGFIGVARLVYRPTDGIRAGNETTVEVNVTGKPSWPASGRKDAFIWYFGNGAGLDFSSGVPVPLTNGQINTLEGCAVISDPEDGRLLFYTDGVTVWDATHRPMPNGNDLKGHWTSAQSALIVPNPGDTNIFYVFTAGAGFYHTANDPNNGVRYSVVNMQLNGGRGDVIEKNIELLERGRGVEMLNATRHCNGRDYWVVAHELKSNRFFMYLVTPGGITDSVITSIGSVLSGDLGALSMGKFSPNGKMLAVATPGEQTLELYDFDNASGRLLNYRLIASDWYYYGPEFSPDNSKLYVASLARLTEPDFLYQFDLNAGDIQAIRNSRYQLHREEGRWDGAQCQLGPDNRIYVSFRSRYRLGVINFPNVEGAGANYQHNGVQLAGRTTSYGLPNLINADLFGIEPRYLLVDLGVSSNIEKGRIGDTVIYSLQLCNNSSSEIRDFVFEFPLPSGLEYLDGLSAYPDLSVTSIDPGECEKVQIRAVVSSKVRFNTSLTSCLSVTQEDKCISIDSSCATITVPATDLYVRKDVNANRAETGDQLVYTISIANQRPVKATNIIVSDVLPSSVEYINHVVNGVAVFDSLTDSLIISELDVGQKVQLMLTCQIKSDVSGQIQNCAELIELDQVDLDPSNNHDCSLTTVGPCDALYVIRAHIGHHNSHGSGLPLTIPVMLDELSEDLRINKLQIVVGYDPSLMLLDDNSNLDLIAGTLLEDWRVVSLKNEIGEVVIDVEALPGLYLRDTGILVQLHFRMYFGIGRELDSDLPLSIIVPDLPCVNFQTIDGHARLDSICGLSWRIIELLPNSKYALNIPHPVMETATIEFSLGLDGETALEIFNSQGQIVATLIDDYLMPGTYNAMWNISDIVPGVYFCRLRSGVWEDVKRVYVVGP